MGREEHGGAAQFHGSRQRVKKSPRISSVVGPLLLLGAGWLVAGCAGPSAVSSAPQPGKGIAAYRQVTQEAHRSVAATVKALEALAQPNTRTTVYPGLSGFDRAFNDLELTSVKARARAEAIIARGQAYFDEWKERLAGATNQPATQAETERYARLFAQFEHVRQKSGDVRAEFRPFMAKLREFRARLDRFPNPATDPSPLQDRDELIASGRRVLQTLEAVSTALDEAEKELHATLASRR
jgi:small-conductance mechanosensitive channel